MDRRNFLWGLGGLAVGVGLTTAAAFGYRAHRRRVFVASLPPEPPPPGFAAPTGDGNWLLSTADHEALVNSDFLPTSASLEIVPNADLPGDPFSRNRVDEVGDCISACEADANCTRFTFAKATHPDASKRRVCWLKTGSGPVEANGARDYISGWR